VLLTAAHGERATAVRLVLEHGGLAYLLEAPGGAWLEPFAPGQSCLILPGATSEETSTWLSGARALDAAREGRFGLRVVAVRAGRRAR
jgi:hypothetical protein